MFRFLIKYKRQIFYGLILLIFLNIIRVGYFKKYNTYINIASYMDKSYPYDIEVRVDDKVLFKDIVDTIEYGFFGKLHPVQVNPGRHDIVVKSDKLNMADSTIFYSILFSHFYIEIWEDKTDNRRGIGIDKRYGRKIIFE